MRKCETLACVLLIVLTSQFAHFASATDLMPANRNHPIHDIRAGEQGSFDNDVATVETQRRPSERSRSSRSWSRIWRGLNTKNHSDVKTAFDGAAKASSRSTASVFVDDKEVALATVVDADGYLVTKASLIREDKNLTVRIADQDQQHAAVIVGQSEEFDVALLKVEGAACQPIHWRADIASPGTIVAATDAKGNVLGVGVVSTEPRRIRRTNRNAPPRRAWLGVSLGDGSNGTGVSDVIDGGAAQRAKVKTGDEILAINDKPMKNMVAIIETIGNQYPGDTVTLRLRRDGKELEVTATLGSPPSEVFPQDHWGGGPFSARRDDFPEVFAHDTVVTPQQCGGPLVDTDGNCVGVNIARALRVTTYAIDSTTLQTLVAELKKS